MSNKKESRDFLLYLAIAIFIVLSVPITFLITDKISQEVLRHGASHSDEINR